MRQGGPFLLRSRRTTPRRRCASRTAARIHEELRRALRCALTGAENGRKRLGLLADHPGEADVVVPPGELIEAVPTEAPGIVVTPRSAMTEQASEDVHSPSFSTVRLTARDPSRAPGPAARSAAAVASSRAAATAS